MLQEFKKFILRGNVVDLAVAVAVGAAFSSVVTAFVTDFINPLISLIPGNENLSAKIVTLYGAEFRYGNFLSKLLVFILTAAVIFFVVVKPVNHFLELTRRKQPTSDPTTRKCPFCFSVIDVKATRCSFCTSEIKPKKKAA